MCLENCQIPPWLSSQGHMAWNHLAPTPTALGSMEFYKGGGADVALWIHQEAWVCGKKSALTKHQQLRNFYPPFIPQGEHRARRWCLLNTFWEKNINYVHDNIVSKVTPTVVPTCPVQRKMQSLNAAICLIWRYIHHPQWTPEVSASVEYNRYNNILKQNCQYHYSWALGVGVIH